MEPSEHFNLEKFDVEYFRVVIDQYRLHAQPEAVHLRPLLEGMRVDFRYSTLTPNLNGLALVVPGTGERKIRVRRDLDSCWRRFIIGHELGHIFQYNQGRVLFSVAQDWEKDTGDSWQMLPPLEEEAYAISAYLYLPLDLMQRELYRGTPFEAIAALQGLPVDAVKLRYEIALATGEFL